MHFPTFFNASWLITHILLCWKISFYVKSISNCCCITWQDWNELQTLINWNILGLKPCALQTQTVSKYHILAACIQDHLEDMASVWWGLLTASLTCQTEMVWCEIVCDTMGVFLGFGVDPSTHQKGTSMVSQPSLSKLVGMMWDAPSCRVWLYPWLMFFIPTAVFTLVSSALEVHSTEPASSILRMS